MNEKDTLRVILDRFKQSQNVVLVGVRAETVYLNHACFDLVGFAEEIDFRGAVREPPTQCVGRLVPGHENRVLRVTDVVFDVMAIFLYAWGSALLELPKSATLPMMGFLAIMFGAMAFALYQSGRRRIW